MNLSKYIMPQLEQLNATQFNQSEVYADGGLMNDSISQLFIDHSFKIVESVSSPEGKWPASYGSVIVVSTQTLQNLLNEMFEELVQSKKTPLEEKPTQWINDWTMQYLILSSNHQQIYTSSDSSK